MSRDTLAPGLQLAGQYTLICPLGRGGMAAVWEARNQANQRVAIKMLSAAFSENAELVARFFLEARAATSIAHPGIVEANVEHHCQLEVKGQRSASQLVRVLTAETKTLQLE